MYILSNEMHRELLKTFEAARDRALDHRDEDSAAYYWGLVEYLQAMPRTNTLRDLGRLGHFKSLQKRRTKKDIEKPKVQKDVAHSDIIQSSGMKLKEVADWLRRDHSLTASEKFELYYEEHLRLKEEKGLKDINALLDSVGIDKNNRGKKNGS